MWSGHPYLLVFTFTSHPAFVLLLNYCCAFIANLFFYCHPLFFSSSAISFFFPHFFLSFGELLSYLFLSCGLERKQTGTEQKGAAIPLCAVATLWILSSLLLRFLISVAFYSPLNSSIFNSDSPSVSHCILNASTFCAQLCLTLYTFLYLNFYFSLFAALNLYPVFFSLTPTTICSFFSL